MRYLDRVAPPVVGWGHNKLIRSRTVADPNAHIDKAAGSPWDCGMVDKVSGVKPNPHKRDALGVKVAVSRDERAEYIRGYLFAAPRVAAA